MATTSPDDIWTPDAGDDYALTTDLAAMADTIQDALTAIRASSGTRKGTTTQRNAATATNGDYWADTTDNFLYRHNGTSWFYAPGQRLGYMSATATNGVTNTIIGTVVSTPVLPVGQRLKVKSSRVSGSATGAGPISYALLIRNNASDVTPALYDKDRLSRAYQGGGSLVVSVPGVETEFVTTAAAKVSAAIVLGSGTWTTFGADGQELWIESF